MNMLEAIADGAKIAHEQRVEIEKLQARVRELEADLKEMENRYLGAADIASKYRHERITMEERVREGVNLRNWNNVLEALR